MNSKERVLTAVGLGQPDRVPLDFSANAATLARLHRDLGTTTHRELLDRLHVDILDLRGVVDPIYCGPIPKERWLPGDVKENFWGWRTKVMQTAIGPEECYVDFRPVRRHDHRAAGRPPLARSPTGSTSPASPSGWMNGGTSRSWRRAPASGSTRPSCAASNGC